MARCCKFLKTNPNVPDAALFAVAFSLPWIGAVMVVLNSILLGGSMSFFQAVSLMGYCVFPLAVSSLISIFLKPGKNASKAATVSLFIAKLVICIVGFLWGTLASVGFFAGLLPPKRKALAVYPVFLLFAIIAWLILAI